ncbi:MAG: AraC family transcriptional regulator [Synergistaceae bacterium]|nr:AraC family transcriptional regulator [Synergistaceae bacterium]
MPRRRVRPVGGGYRPFNPRDNHCCSPLGVEALDYRAVNIGPQVLSRLLRETGLCAEELCFTKNVLFQSDIAQPLAALYDAVAARAPKMEREEALFFLLEQLIEECAAPRSERGGCDERIRLACGYLEEHFAENVALGDLTALTGYGKSYLIRSFTKETGLSPYRYLQTVRLGRAKRFLEGGVPPVEAADLAGFADQSHFTNFHQFFQRIYRCDAQTISADILFRRRPVKWRCVTQLWKFRMKNA